MLKPGLMMDRPLLLSGILGARSDAVWRPRSCLARNTWPFVSLHLCRLCKALTPIGQCTEGLNLKEGSVVGSIAWNNHRHLEAYYAVSGSGMVMHTCNPRLHPQQLIYIINHAEDEVVLFDITFAPLIKGIAAHCPKVRAWVCLTERAHMPEIEGVSNVLCYDELIAFASDVFEWPDFDERSAAAICYTSGTTGNPKGAMYSHRAIVIDACPVACPVF
jgi:3-(methylthio)propionyl---CoA ligase